MLTAELNRVFNFHSQLLHHNDLFCHFLWSLCNYSNLVKVCQPKADFSLQFCEVIATSQEPRWLWNGGPTVCTTNLWCRFSGSEFIMGWSHNQLSYGTMPLVTEKLCPFASDITVLRFIEFDYTLSIWPSKMALFLWSMAAVSWMESRTKPIEMMKLISRAIMSRLRQRQHRPLEIKISNFSGNEAN